MTRPWTQLGSVSPRNLEASRLQLHRAIQIAADVGRSYGPSRPDDSHTNLVYLHGRGALAGQSTAGQPRARAMLQISPPSLLVEGIRDSRARILGILPLKDVRAQDAWSWLEARLRDHLGGKRSQRLGKFTFPIPEGPGSGPVPFSGEPLTHFDELKAWYANAAALLTSVRRKLPGASAVRCWPHHFDIAFLLPVSRGRGRPKGTIGVGLSPGDASYPEPYWYVTPWPHAVRPFLPALPDGGHWHTDEWTGAVLTGSRVVAAGSASRQRRASEEFLRRAVAACRKVIETADRES